MDNIKGVPIGNLLYTVEDEKSKEKTKAELAAPDPVREKALGVLESKKDEQKTD